MSTPGGSQFCADRNQKSGGNNPVFKTGGKIYVNFPALLQCSYRQPVLWKLQEEVFLYHSVLEKSIIRSIFWRSGYC